ncbi:MAG: hypothetical protein JW873_07250 [Candidatus Saganbacteria bacterium]|nr:hypothetical protein [Candidatus Saganbacteria bacterium]
MLTVTKAGSAVPLAKNAAKAPTAELPYPGKIFGPVVSVNACRRFERAEGRCRAVHKTEGKR